MSEFLLERFKYRWIGDWQPNTDYRKDDIVRLNGKAYVCLEGHTSASLFTTDLNYIVPNSIPPQPKPKWVVMISGKSHEGTWQSARRYEKGDLVTYQGSIYECIEGHTSTNFSSDAELVNVNIDPTLPRKNWKLFALGSKFLTIWQSGTHYGLGDLVRISSLVYECVKIHESTDFENDKANWKIYYSGKTFRGDFQEGLEYAVNDLVKYGPNMFTCIEAHLSTDVFDNSKFELELLGTSFKGNWIDNEYYSIGDVVRYGGILYYALNNNYDSNPSATQVFDTNDDSVTDWVVLSLNYNFRNAWNTENVSHKTFYVTVEDDTVLGKTTGNFYIDKQETPTLAFETKNIYVFDQSEPSNAEYYVEPHPLLFSYTLNGTQGGGVSLTQNVTYLLDNLVVSEADYISNFASAISRQVIISFAEREVAALYYYSHTFPGMGNSIILSEQVQTPPYYEKYLTGDVVLRGGDTYRAVRDTNVSDGNASTRDYEDPEVWERLNTSKIFSQNWKVNRIYSLNQLVIFLGSVYICNAEHLSTGQNSPINNAEGFWTFLVQSVPSALLDIGDLVTYGLIDQELAGGDGSTFGETRLPIGNALSVLSVSDEQELFWNNRAYNSTTIYVSQNGSDENNGFTEGSAFATIRKACEFVYDTYAPLTPVKIFVSTGTFTETGPITIPAGTVVMGDELRSTVIKIASANPSYVDMESIFLTYSVKLKQVCNAIILNSNYAKNERNIYIQDKSLPAGSSDAGTELSSIIDDCINYFTYRFQNGAEVTITGSNSLLPSSYLNAAALLTLNARFIAEEIYLYAEESMPLITVPKDEVVSDILHLIRGFNRDLRYSGNYASILSVRKLCNLIEGAEKDDLFWVRDATGLRNCTVVGYTGTIAPDNVSLVERRPTNGSIVALDPGWGPDDSSAWINNRSPYMQGVTNIADGCVGMKIDGDLHNGGNRSMVANDYTQVLSDGIGAWIRNNARAELVSVFTYYCHIGYLAENGGIIRATNGNNSYGNYGSLAIGIDPTEIPQAITVNNRQYEATVSSAFAGGASDELLVFEMAHCGQDYTFVNADIDGAGASVNLTYTDFRDNAISNFRLLPLNGSENTGGSGYTRKQNSAQATINAQARIIVNVNESAQFLSEIEGLRIIITSGTGVGQYGIVSGYDFAFREITVTRESDGQPGWDHIIPGTPIEDELDASTIYRMEPRVTVATPTSTFTTNPLSALQSWVDAEYGYTKSTYANLAGGSGSGNNDIQIAARFTVIRQGPEYILTMTNSGANYVAGDIIVLSGDSLGGATPLNDITITVQSATEDSTGSIISYTYTGQPTGKRLVLLSNNDYVLYSDNGTNFSSITVPANEYSALIAGNNSFVALIRNSNQILYSSTGESWSIRSLPIPTSEQWIDGAFGNGVFVAIADESSNAVYSVDGLDWSISAMPANPDSSSSQWQAIAFGQGRFVALSGNFHIAISENGSSWSIVENAIPVLKEWVGLAYGGNRFVGLASDGTTIYSLDRGVTWYLGNSLPLYLDAPALWCNIIYGQGVFFASAIDPITQTGIDLFATSENGYTWTGRGHIEANAYKTIVFANFNNNPKFYAFGNNVINNGILAYTVGKTALIRANVTSSSIANFTIIDPGSGYTSTPTITITDPNVINEVEYEFFIQNGTIAQPDFINRGAGYRTATTVITLQGDGFAEIIPIGNYVYVQGVNPNLPGPGVQLLFSSILDLETDDENDLKLYIGLEATDLGDDGTGNNTRLVKFMITPQLKPENALAHGAQGIIRERYSQCRISGHDFLDIGTGNFTQTNYPELYAGGAYFVSAPENETEDIDGGRVFYVSTDQDGNFRTGELFAVQQATGVVTISAEFFDLDGLSELSLGGVRLGGTGTVVNEFSKDQTFSADSNNVIPTQRAIAGFLANRLSVGGSDLEVNSFTAGRVEVGSDANIIDLIGDDYLDVPRNVIFHAYDNLGNPAGLRGHYLARLMFFRSFSQE